MGAFGGRTRVRELGAKMITILELDRVNIAVDGRPILHDITLRIEAGETHVLFGPNRSGRVHRPPH